MATLYLNSPKGKIDSAADYNFSSPGKIGGVLTVQIDNDNTLAGASIVLQARAQTRAGFTGAFVPIPYIKLYLNGAVGDGTVVSTTITTSSIIQIPVADGMEFNLAVTGTVTGSASVYIRAVTL